MAFGQRLEANIENIRLDKFEVKLEKNVKLIVQKFIFSIVEILTLNPWNCSI